MSKRNLLLDESRAAVMRVAAPSSLLAFDFDGTLAPIVDSPPAAAMRASTRARLVALAARRQVAVISGRSLADVSSRLEGVSTVAIVGNHGIEPSPQLADAHARIGGWMPALRAAIGHLDGVVIENKGASLAIHYRHAASPSAVRSAIDAVVQRLGTGVRRVEGLEVINLIPDGAPTKGDALLRLGAEVQASAVFYIGDEETDEDAFAVLDRATALAVRVGPGDHSHAEFFIPEQVDIDTVLDLLLSAAIRHDAQHDSSESPASHDRVRPT